MRTVTSLALYAVSQFGVIFGGAAIGVNIASGESLIPYWLAVLSLIIGVGFAAIKHYYDEETKKL